MDRGQRTRQLALRRRIQQSWLLALVSAEAVVVGLTLRALGPLAAGGLLAAPIAASALRATIAHGLPAVSSGRLRARAGEVTGLASVLAF